MTDTINRTVAEALIDLGKLVLELGQVNRVTLLPDRMTPESDTDHTVMLTLIAPAFASQYVPDLDPHVIASFAAVHDLVEVYAGDTPTLKINGEQLQEKKLREEAAANRIYNQFKVTLPWIPTMIREYEQQRIPEARYVKAMDKILPKITHILNYGQTLDDEGVDQHFLYQRLAKQLEEIRGYTADMPEVEVLYRIMRSILFETCFGADDES